MSKIQEWFKGKKTYVLSGLGFLVILVGFLSGDMSFIEFMQSPEFKWLWALLTASTLRAGMGTPA